LKLPPHCYPVNGRLKQFLFNTFKVIVCKPLYIKIISYQACPLLLPKAASIDKEDL
jgi:hypothetical protein